MKDKVFINEAFDNAIKAYINSIDKPNSLNYNTSLVVPIRILVLIYGKLDIINPYYLENSVVFFENLGKYGISPNDLALFKEDFLAFYKFEINNEKRKIKEKNPYLKNVLNRLIDMFIAKKKNSKVSLAEEDKFLELIYSTHTKNPYRISYAYLMLGDLNYTEKYYYTKLNELDVTSELDLTKTFNTKINLDALDIMGINLTKIKNMNDDEIKEAKNKAYNYFQVDASKASREDDLKTRVKYFKMTGEKLSSGNGYVDILLLMSVIITSFSVIAIIIFSVM